ncbi:glycosyltransferase family 2 protein [Devosia rhodophyticola]|uniref:Glycosyltransferase family 2 protein n=1 Tax=Devosia rhodophyticola TaxID=3026423 RepID=A0ABY7YWW4_9HYPH|nr:glycosyltransferase family 2 protein [Devosia rhodophyticola]WDR05834.1 glycosyltransferase family 2 protein [Devosia rhodophyticola]
MKLAFVIPAYNEEALIGKCLESVAREIARTGADAEIVVVNNASTDRTGEVARSFATVRVVDEPKKGLVNARDAGFNATQAELIANIDSDTIVPTGWIDTVLSEFEKDPKLVALSGPYVYYDMSWNNRLLVNAFYGLTYLIYILNRFVLRVGSVVQGGNFVFKRKSWADVGGYDRSIQFFGEDTDVAVRLSKVGNVKWTFALKMMTSGRRLEKEGVFRTAGTYTLNFFWVTFRGKPATKDYTDIRPD